MSGKKGFETDETTDSGFISGPIDRFPGDDDDVAAKESDSTKVDDRSEKELYNPDSGVDLTISQDLDSLSLGTEVPSVHRRLVTEVKSLGDLFKPDHEGDTQLHIAAVHGCQKSVGTLVNVCPDRLWIDLPNDYGHTALHLAVLSGDPIVTRMLVQVGASVGVRDLNGNTPVHLATEGKLVDCLQALLNPVDIHPRKIPPFSVLNLKNYDGQTCVHIAASSGSLDTMKKLVFYGADINAREGLAGWTALHIAARRGDAALTQYLVDRCPGVAVRARDYAGRTPRRLARRAKSLPTKDGQRLMKALLEDSDSESETEDEYDSDDNETMFDKLRSTMTATSLVTN